MNVVEKAKELINCPSCCQELKDCAKTWIDSIGTDKEQSAAKEFVESLEENIRPIDSLVEFAHSDIAKQIFGEGYEGFVKHSDELKKSGAKYCDCQACTISQELLSKKILFSSN